MANIWNEIEIQWGDETYTVRPTMDFINHLEQGQGRSLSKLFVRLVDGDLPNGIACELIAKTLTWAGAKGVTAEDVFHATSGGLDSHAITTASSIIVGCMPKTPAKKKPEASTTKRRRR